jgi:hypothetical protein
MIDTHNTIYIKHKCIVDWLTSKSIHKYSQNILQIEKSFSKVFIKQLINARDRRAVIDGSYTDKTHTIVSEGGIHQAHHQAETASSMHLSNYNYTKQHGISHLIHAECYNEIVTFVLDARWLLSRRNQLDNILLELSRICECLEIVKHNLYGAVVCIKKAFLACLSELRLENKQICAQLVGRLLGPARGNQELTTFIKNIKEFDDFDWWCPITSCMPQVDDPTKHIMVPSKTLLDLTSQPIFFVKYNSTGTQMAISLNDKGIGIYDTESRSIIKTLVHKNNKAYGSQGK